MAFDNDALSMPSPTAAPISGPMPQPIAPEPDLSPAPAAPVEPGQGAPANIVPPANAKGPSKYGASDAPMRPWMQILQGALWGLSGVQKEGRGGFVVGAAQGIRGYTGMKFASVKAATDYTLAQKQAQEADLAIKEHQLNLALTDASYKAWMARNGIEPIGTIDADNTKDMHAQAAGMMETIGQANNGVLPPIVTTNSPIGVGADTANHNTTVYAPTSPSSFEQALKVVDPHTTRVPNMVNEVRRAQHLPPLTDQQWASAGITPENAGPSAALKAGDQVRIAQKGMIDDSSKFMAIPELAPAKSAAAEDIDAANRPIVSKLESDIDNYKAMGGDQPETLKQLTNRLNGFKSRVANAQSGSIQDTKARVLAGGGSQQEADSVFRGIDMKLMQKEPLDDKESAFFHAYKDQKTLQQQFLLTAGNQMSPDALDMASKAFLATGQMPPTGFGPAGTSMRMAIMNHAAQLAKSDPTYAGLAPASAQFKANQKSYTDLNDTLNKLQAFESSAGKNLDMFLNMTDKLPDTGLPWLNQPVRQIDEKAVGAEWLPAVRTAREVALREIARVTSDPKLSGSLTDSARQEVKGLSPDDATVPQIKHVAQILRNDMKNVEDGLGQQRDFVGGRLGIKPGPSGPAAVNPPATGSTIPPGAKAIRDANKNVVGYILNGQRTNF